MSADTVHEQMVNLVLPICEELGLQLYDLEVKPSSSQGLVRVVLEREGASGPGTGVTLAQITDVTRQLNYLLDVEDFIPFRYRLEVTSPGVERTLTKPSHWERNKGETVRVVLREQTPDGEIVLKGILLGNDAYSAEVQCEDGKVRVANFDVVKRARTVYDFSKDSQKPKKPGRG